MSMALRPGSGWTRSWGVAALLVALNLLGGCAGLPSDTDVSNDPSGVSAYGFTVTGRFAVSQRRADRSDGGSGRLQWQHAERTDDIVIRDPIGSQRAHILREDALYTLELPDQAPIRAYDPDALTERALGFSLPLAGLPFWLRGEPAPAVPLDAPLVLGADERVRSLYQAGWTIDVLARHTDSALPSRIDMRRDGLQIRLILSTWGAP